jgi:hypothetical protein
MRVRDITDPYLIILMESDSIILVGLLGHLSKSRKMGIKKEDSSTGFSIEKRKNGRNEVSLQ